MFTLKVFDVGDGKLVYVGERNVGPGSILSGIFRVPTDPEHFYLDDYDSMAQDMMAYTVGPAGLPELKE